MLANLLAVIVGLGSLAFYLAAFILPEVHRRSDFLWSGVGMFYAVVLWYCARQLNGAVLLGQTAAVGLVLWLGYQTLLLRRQTTPSAQQTPIRLGKAARSRLNGSVDRPIAKDYEFVEDGVDDIIEPAPDPDSPILIKPAADEFAPKMVVPAAIPTPSLERENPNSLASETPAVSKAPQKRKKPNPIAAVGIFAGWLKDIVTPKKKETKPMIELPPRPPSIPKPDKALETDTIPKSSTPAPDSGTPITATEISIDRSQATTATDAVAKPAITPSPPANKESPQPAATPQQEDEDSNWPDDDFWD